MIFFFFFLKVFPKFPWRWIEIEETRLFKLTAPEAAHFFAYYMIRLTI